MRYRLISRLMLISALTVSPIHAAVSLPTDNSAALPAEAIRPTPEFASTTFDTRYITGLATVEENLLILLDIEKLLSGADMALVESAVH